MENIGKVFITGLIGNDYNEDGTLKEKGVELVDVVEQVADLGEVDETHFIIKSQGGNVNVGKDIRDFIASIPNAKTIAKELCASIATVIHTAVPLQNRFIEEGTQYMIHNPWGTVSGDANTMANAANAFQEVEKDLEAHYAKATGTKKETVSALMAVETYLTMDQCKKLGFASQIIPKPTLQAVAKIQITNTINMSTNDKSKLAVAMAKIGAKFGIKNEIEAPATDRVANAVMITTDKGTIETPFEDVFVGDPVMIEGEPAENGDYTISEGEFIAIDGMISTGTVIKVEDGIIASIEPGVTDDAENLAALQAKLDASEAENATLKASNETLETENNAAAEQLETLAKMGSNFTPPVAKASFRSVETNSNGVTKDGINDILKKKK